MADQWKFPPPFREDPIIKQFAREYPAAMEGMPKELSPLGVFELLAVRTPARKRHPDCVARLRFLIESALESRLDRKHRWVPIAECGELADGLYWCRADNYGQPWDALFRRHGGSFGDGNRVTHVLSPSLGPIPEVSR